jgi:hypothetical protein
VAKAGRGQQSRRHADRATAGRAAIAQEHIQSIVGEYLPAVEIGGRADAVDFRFDRLIFRVQRAALLVRDGAGGRFRGQRDRAIEQRGDLRKCAVCYLQFANAVSGVACRLRQSRDVGLQAVGNGEAGRIVRAAVDARTRRQLLQRRVQTIAGDVQLVFRSNSSNIIENG